MKTNFLLFALLMIGSPLVGAAPGPGAGNDFQGKRVLIIGVDGIRPDALQAANAPVMLGMAKAGTGTMKSVAGGDLNNETKQPTISGSGWATLLTGVYTDKHGIVGNGTNAYNQQPIPKGGSYQVEVAPHFAKYLRKTVPTASFCSITSWPWIEDYFNAAQPQFLDHHTKAAGENYIEADEDVSRQAVTLLANANPDVLFLHYSQIDGAGHGTGFTPENPAYLSAIETVDALIGQVIDAVEARPQFAKEDWLYMVVTDHGGKDRAHGGQSEEERTIPMIVAGKGSSARGIVDETPGYHVVPATVFQFFGLPVKAEWAWQPGTFGLD